MERMIAIEDKFKGLIDTDIESNFGAQIVESRDPLGDSIYLFFLTRKNISSSAIDALCDWMNAWIENILIDQNISRFIDREFTSAILGYHTLHSNKRLMKKINAKQINVSISKLLTGDSFFNNFTYSVIVLYSLVNERYEIESFNRVYTWIRKSAENELIFNDAKNLVFTSLLFDEMNSHQDLKKIVDYCFQKISSNNIRFNDKIYYAWVLWNFRDLREESELSKIVDFTKSTLQNITQVISDGVIEPSIIDVYGTNTKPGFSKILLATALDLIIDFNDSGIAISLPSRVYIQQKLQELSWLDISRELDNALKAFEEGRTGDCCNNLRMGLITTLVKIYELFERQQAPTPPGKTTDIGPLMNTLEQYGFSGENGSMIRRTWSYVSERAHIEKRSGKLPNEPETRYAIQTTFAAIEFLLRFLSENNR